MPGRERADGRCDGYLVVAGANDNSLRRPGRLIEKPELGASSEQRSALAVPLEAVRELFPARALDLDKPVTILRKYLWA